MRRRIPDKKITVHMHSAQAVLHPQADRTVKISNLYAQQRARGHASALLSEIVGIADEEHILLWLEVQRYGAPRDGLDNNQLMEFYRKFGFVKVEDGRKPVMMHRLPRERST
jgi:GNAT superfamily N-acetyltransferase